MKKLILSIIALSAMGSTQAQLELPAPSPAASVSQTVGLTEVKIEYSAPGVKGREIFGALVPYNELWRTGANASTKITFSKEVNMGGTAVPAGTYAIFTIPGESEWTFILSKNAKQSGTGSYKKEEDAVRIQVKAGTCAPRERLNFQITDFDDNGGFIVMEWASVQIRVPFATATREQAMKNIDNTLNGLWRNYARSAQYVLDSEGDLALALKYINAADEMNKDSWYVLWIKAQIQYKSGDKVNALATAKRAQELGAKDGDGFFWKAQVDNAVNTWK
ncbi:MAG: DUF2911 domain-containing protein [Bacteroidia bacterium]